MSAPPSAQDEVLEVLRRGVQLMRQSPQVLRLQAVVLVDEQRGSFEEQSHTYSSLLLR